MIAAIRLALWLAYRSRKENRTPWFWLNSYRITPIDWLTSASTTLPPPFTIIRAVAAPRPEATPVTTNTLSCIFILKFSNMPRLRG